jgi:hypothetical protein
MLVRHLQHLLDGLRRQHLLHQRSEQRRERRDRGDAEIHRGRDLPIPKLSVSGLSPRRRRLARPHRPLRRRHPDHAPGQRPRQARRLGHYPPAPLRRLRRQMVHQRREVGAQLGIAQAAECRAGMLSALRVRVLRHQPAEELADDRRQAADEPCHRRERLQDWAQGRDERRDRRAEAAEAGDDAGEKLHLLRHRRLAPAHRPHLGRGVGARHAVRGMREGDRRQRVGQAGLRFDDRRDRRTGARAVAKAHELHVTHLPIEQGLGQREARPPHRRLGQRALQRRDEGRVGKELDPLHPPARIGAKCDAPVAV